MAGQDTVSALLLSLVESALHLLLLLLLVPAEEQLHFGQVAVGVQVVDLHVIRQDLLLLLFLVLINLDAQAMSCLVAKRVC